jgi:hypothetical protein
MCRWLLTSKISTHPNFPSCLLFSITLTANKLNNSMRRSVLFAWLLLLTITARSQETFPVNGVAEPKAACYAFTNATIVKDAATSISNATMLIRDGKIVAVGTAITIPADALVVDCKGKFIYPSFIDLYADYGMPVPQRSQGGFNFNAPAQLTSRCLWLEPGHPHRCAGRTYFYGR